MRLSRELTGQRLFTAGDMFQLKLRLHSLNKGLRRGVKSGVHEGVVYRIKLDRVEKGRFNAIILEFLFQSGNRVRYLLCNGIAETDKTLHPLNYKVRPDRILDLSTFERWMDVRNTITEGLIEAENLRYNASFYRSRVEM